MMALLMFVGLLALILINVPIAVALGAVAMAAMVWHGGMESLLGAAITMFNGATSFPLLAIPLFVLAGAIMNSSSLSRRLIAFASALFGFIKGGLAMVNIGTSLFFAEISGSAVADVAAMGSMNAGSLAARAPARSIAASAAGTPESQMASRPALTSSLVRPVLTERGRASTSRNSWQVRSACCATCWRQSRARSFLAL